MFSKWPMHDVTKSCMSKRSTRCKIDQWILMLTKHEKFIDMVSESTLQITFKKLLLIEFWWSIKEVYSQLPEKAIKIFLPYPTTYYVRPDFLHTLQSKQHTTTDRMQKQIGESSCFLLNQTLKRFVKMKNNATLLIYLFLFWKI